MPIVWFDQPKNNGGSLAARLASDCQIVNGMTTTFFAILVQNLSTLVAGLVISLANEWRTSLVALGLIPFLILAGAIQMSKMNGFSDKTDTVYKDSADLIMESMINIRTVSSFGYESVISKKYN
eukprot:GHVR01024025.1.p1 GENE.GHVR01024025.1~~GHVR01024025.1.p1  ORF type:complete len:124 (+),score=0.20 GHVR01024025.1:1147-1518(+)